MQHRQHLFGALHAGAPGRRGQLVQAVQQQAQPHAGVAGRALAVQQQLVQVSAGGVVLAQVVVQPVQRVRVGGQGGQWHIQRQLHVCMGGRAGAALVPVAQEIQGQALLVPLQQRGLASARAAAQQQGQRRVVPVRGLQLAQQLHQAGEGPGGQRLGTAVGHRARGQARQPQGHKAQVQRAALLRGPGGPALQRIVHQAAHGLVLAQHLLQRLGRGRGRRGLVVGGVGHRAVQGQAGENGLARRVGCHRAGQGLGQLAQAGHGVQRQARDAVGAQLVAVAGVGEQVHGVGFGPHAAQRDGLGGHAAYAVQVAVVVQRGTDAGVGQHPGVDLEQRLAQRAGAQLVLQQPQGRQRHRGAGRRAVQPGQRGARDEDVPGQRQVLGLGGGHLAAQHGRGAVHRRCEARGAGRERAARRGHQQQVGAGRVHRAQAQHRELAIAAVGVLHQQAHAAGVCTRAVWRGSGQGVDLCWGQGQRRCGGHQPIAAQAQAQARLARRQRLLHGSGMALGALGVDGVQHAGHQAVQLLVRRVVFGPGLAMGLPAPGHGRRHVHGQALHGGAVSGVGGLHQFVQQAGPGGAGAVQLGCDHGVG